MYTFKILARFIDHIKLSFCVSHYNKVLYTFNFFMSLAGI
jgi:hypothetical protein